MTAASAGAALLDEKRPLWEREIDPDEIRMASCGACVLGLLFLDYHDGLVDLGIMDKAADYGFTTPFDPNATRETIDRSFAELADEWKDEIASRVAGRAS